VVGLGEEFLFVLPQILINKNLTKKKMDILRIATAGSVDDGKSTLIGRLLYETRSITEDKLAALETASKRKGLDFLDLSLLTDGLIAEREQGITIDVAHIYFSTQQRKYIIADTPGHFEYTRNMITGASNTEVSLILIDARNGVVEQTFRHFYISTLLRVPEVIVCINKMDLVDYDVSHFQKVKSEFEQIAGQLALPKQQIRFIPLSSLYGENLAQKSTKMPWYTGDSLLETLENISITTNKKEETFSRFPVQYVIRPKTANFHDYRGYAGKVASGVFEVGDAVEILPSGQKTTITTIEKFDQKLTQASAKESVVISLADDVNVSRGDMLVRADQGPLLRRELQAQICWFDDQQPLQVGKTYSLQHGPRVSKAKVTQVDHRINVQNLEKEYGLNQLRLNDIGQVQLRLALPIFVDAYAQNPANGAFILIDEHSQHTVAVGFVLD
jgi:sulfate adenylyltransferase subunit 1